MFACAPHLWAAALLMLWFGVCLSVIHSSSTPGRCAAPTRAATLVSSVPHSGSQMTRGIAELSRSVPALREKQSLQIADNCIQTRCSQRHRRGWLSSDLAADLLRTRCAVRIGKWSADHRVADESRPASSTSTRYAELAEVGDEKPGARRQ
ncbi:MAG: hypothetical protein QOJ56_1493 [Mycobacterium sp.]|nr:hypothetical protein [Mycobacterium sp.]